MHLLSIIHTFYFFALSIFDNTPHIIYGSNSGICNLNRLNHVLLCNNPNKILYVYIKAYFYHIKRKKFSWSYKMDHKKAIKIGFTCFTLCIMGLCLLEIAGTTPESDAWYNKGYALSQQNKFDESIKAYDKAIEINPQLRSSAQ